MTEFLPNLGALSWLAVIPILGVLIFVHELGHFLAARLVKVKVEEFGFGYPPRMLTLFERDGVKYTLNWLPLGGFVRMVGEEGNYDVEGSLYSKKPWQRALVLFAGPAMNLLFAALTFALIFGVFGIPIPDRFRPTGRVVVTAVVPGSPAAIAGLQRRDVILQIDGKQVHTPEELKMEVEQRAGQPVHLLVDRQNQLVEISLTPRRAEDTPAGQGPMGVGIGAEGDYVYRRLPPLEALVSGFAQMVFSLLAMIGGLAELVRGLLFPNHAVPAGGVAGPIGIARLTGEVVQEGLRPLLGLAAFLSVNLGLLNLLPLPALDGGRLFFVFLEWLRGKRIPPEREALVHALGMALLLTFILIISYFDLANWLRGGSIIPGG